MEKINYTPQKGDVFKWCDEEYICIESREYSGVVNPTGENYYIRNFIWNYGGEFPEFMHKLEVREFENLFGEL